MFTAFSTALSALNANALAVDVIGNNLANLNTTGYKTSGVQFHDLLAQTLGVGSSGTDIGLGVGRAGTLRQFTQGSIQTTSGAFDAAIQGDGFFVVRDANSQVLYTRAGNFRLDASGNLVTATGEHVQGWNATAGVLTPGGAPTNITLPVGAVIPASATTKMNLTANLDSRAAVGTVLKAPVEVIDSQGASHVLTATFTKTDVNKWDFEITIPATDLKSGGTTSVSKGSLAFDSAGQLTSPASGSDPAVKITGLADGAADMNLTWNLYNPAAKGFLTQFAQSSGVSATSQDGTAAGQIVKLGITDGGLIVAKYSSGQQATVGQVAMAAIRNPETLVSVGNNNLQASADTAAAAVGTADSGGRGKITGGTLESSTVDIATEFTQLITVQRSYQASSKVISASDQLLQDTINLLR
jgi:flagellar hook protein FlgE